MYLDDGGRRFAATDGDSRQHADIAGYHRLSLRTAAGFLDVYVCLLFV